MAVYRVYAYTSCGHHRIGAVQITARNPWDACEKGREQLKQQGITAELARVIPVEADGRMNPFRLYCVGSGAARDMRA
ncbi:hypothetical protein D7S89_15945 [Trinickia fusca]|uniref:Uncharacterized protein n=1 Tax=Trinickia fusca TaxID=2419777 RepID=A0A494XFC7_9BURK|nr:hypothetical protein D7S89_15945 [Trinickia fusca]